MDNFEWDEYNILHATRHGYTTDEAEECFDNKNLIKKKPKSMFRPEEDRFYLLGRTNNNIPLFIVFKKITKYTVRVISVRLMKKEEEEKYGI